MFVNRTASLPLRLVEAIHARRRVRFTYGSEEAKRTVEPFAVGISPNSERLLLAWQVAGPSASADPHGWRHFRLGRLRGLEMTDESFSPEREGYKSDSITFVEVLAKV